MLEVYIYCRECGTRLTISELAELVKRTRRTNQDMKAETGDYPDDGQYNTTLCGKCRSRAIQEIKKQGVKQ